MYEPLDLFVLNLSFHDFSSFVLIFCGGCRPIAI